jgi:methionyl-tRNA formyltransferase
MPNPAKRLRLVLMGTGPFAQPSFAALHALHDVVLVVTRPTILGHSRKGAPPNPIRNWAERERLPVFDPASINEPASIEPLDALSPDLLVVCDYGQILKGHVLEIAPLGGINLHGSLLPRHRGAAPVQWAILAGDRETGVSVIHMTPRLDAGPILAVRRTLIGDEETAEYLEPRLAALGVEATLEAVEQLAQWDRVQPIGTMQVAAEVTKAPRLSKDDGRIVWSRAASAIALRHRGVQPWPGTFADLCLAGKKDPVRVAIQQLRVVDDPRIVEGIADGTVLSGPRESPIVVACGRGAVAIDQLQMAGKKPLSAAEFVRGFPMQPPVRWT